MSTSKSSPARNERESTQEEMSTIEKERSLYISSLKTNQKIRIPQGYKTTVFCILGRWTPTNTRNIQQRYKKTVFCIFDRWTQTDTRKTQQQYKNDRVLYP